MRSVQKGLMAAGVGMAINMVLAIIKIVAGVLGNSYALIADGIESTTDIVSSLVVGPVASCSIDRTSWPKRWAA